MADVKTAVILDTNIYFDKFYMRSGHFEALRDSLEQLNLIWLLPEVVLDEGVGKRKIRVNDLKKAVKQSNQLFKRDDVLLVVINEQKVDNDYENSMKNLFSYNVNMRILSYPSTHHKNIVNRAIYKKKPFKENGDGYRDALLWETILCVCKSEEYYQVLFVTNNTSDLCGKHYKLHASLFEDLDMISVDRNKVSLFTSLYRLITEFIQPRLTTLEDIKAKLVEFDPGEAAGLPGMASIEKAFSAMLGGRRVDLAHSQRAERALQG